MNKVAKFGIYIVAGMVAANGTDSLIRGMMNPDHRTSMSEDLAIYGASIANGAFTGFIVESFAEVGFEVAKAVIESL